MFTTIFSEWTWQNVLVRILTSIVIGTFIGIDRGVKKRGGGARTTVTVCIGATVIMLLEQYMEILYLGKFDITRLGAQVISGVGFLGAGTILISGHQVKGLTSAASIWTSACIGLMIGIGFVDGAILATVIWIVCIHVIPFIEGNVYKRSRYMTLYIEAEDGKSITSVSKFLKEKECFIDSFDVDKPKAKGQNFQIVTTFKLPKQSNKEEYLRLIQELKGIVLVSEI